MGCGTTSLAVPAMHVHPPGHAPVRTPVQVTFEMAMASTPDTRAPSARAETDHGVVASECHVPVELRIRGTPHFAHPAFTEFGGDTVMPEPCADAKRH